MTKAVVWTQDGTRPSLEGLPEGIPCSPLQSSALCGPMMYFPGGVIGLHISVELCRGRGRGVNRGPRDGTWLLHSCTAEPLLPSSTAECHPWFRQPEARASRQWTVAARAMGVGTNVPNIPFSFQVLSYIVVRKVAIGTKN